MNDINNQNLRAVTMRVSVVPSKPEPSRSGNNQVGQNGNQLPPAAKPTQQPVLQSPTPSAKEVQKSAEDSINQESIEAAVAKMNEYTQSLQRDLQFKLDKASGRTVVTVLDRESKEVVRQIPDEVFLKMARNLKSHMELNVNARVGESNGSTLHLINTRA